MGISADPVDRQKQFDDKNSLGFPLLSDPKRKVAALLGAKRMGPIPNKRATYVIGKDATLLAVIKSETDMITHADEALDALKAAA